MQNKYSFCEFKNGLFMKKKLLLRLTKQMIIIQQLTSSSRANRSIRSRRSFSILWISVWWAYRWIIQRHLYCRWWSQKAMHRCRRGLIRRACFNRLCTCWQNWLFFMLLTGWYALMHFFHWFLSTCFKMKFD